MTKDDIDGHGHHLLYSFGRHDGCFSLVGLGLQGFVIAAGGQIVVSSQDGCFAVSLWRCGVVGVAVQERGRVVRVHSIDSIRSMIR